MEGYPLVSPQTNLKLPFMGNKHVDDDTRPGGGGGAFKVLTIP